MQVKKIGSKQNFSPATVKSDAEKVELMRIYNPSLQVRYTDNADRCVMGKAPTLAAVKRDYGEQTVLDWLTIQLLDYEKFCSVRDEAVTDENVRRQMVELILGDFFYLKLSEIMLFLRWLKTGKYGELYGRINPQSIFRALRQFCRDRSEIIWRVENERRQKQDEIERQKAMTRRQHEAYKLEKK